MPLTAKGNKVMAALKTEYGAQKGTSVFYALRNKGKLKGAEHRKGKKPFDGMSRH